MEKITFIKLASFVLIMQPYFSDGQGITKCEYDSSTCSCLTNDGTIYLQQASKEKPYNYSNSGNLDFFFWEPCTDFTVDTTTAGAIQKVISGLTYSLGVHSLASSTATNGYAVFKMQEPSYIRTTLLKCVCGAGDTFVFEKEAPSLTYNFIFTGSACCPNKTSASGLSVGSILVIIFFSLLVAYFVFGTIFQVAVRKAQGRERVPNITVWSTIPGLVRDGCILTFTCGRKSGYTKM